jgi:signal peptidase I
MTAVTPPRLATWLLQRCAGGYRCESLAGDLIEEYHAGRSSAWYWRQVLLAIAGGVGQRMRVEPDSSADVVLVAAAATPSRHKLMARRWREYRGLLLFVLLMCSFRSAWADWVYVPTGSMNPTILEGDRLLIDKHAFGLRIPFSLIHLTRGDNPDRGDIVVFDSPRDGTSLVKRVIGLPGDSVALNGERLIVNGVAARYGAGDASELQRLLRTTRAHDPAVVRESGVLRGHDILLLPDRHHESVLGPVTVPPGMYFVLGDNRDNSADSRYIGFVPRRNIVGRATRVVLSLDPDRYYEPRSGRWLRSL